ncbi:Hypothetical predicted protein [Podarcis lilfordi]|uniref:Uncharacterized protein n=1 Tax=Podarcis lilfordi TaxID=74358 RepID=A0AA35P2J2_9SAUR|nr:Hypothetical predicted protein [Podarcis lilfordi]
MRWAPAVDSNQSLSASDVQGCVGREAAAVVVPPPELRCALYEASLSQSLESYRNSKGKDQLGKNCSPL